MITRTVTRTVARGIFANRSKAPVRDKLLLTLRPYAYGEDVYMDDISGNLGEDVVVEWRERYGEDVPIVAYMIPESMQAAMFAIFGEGLWFDGEGTAKQVNIIELAQSPEMNQWAVWYRLDYAAGLGNREVLFYDPARLTVAEVSKISSWFKDPAPSALNDSILYYNAKADTDRELTGGPSTFNSSILGTQYRRNADGTYTAVPAGGPIVDTFGDGFVGLRSCGAVQNLLPGDTSIARSVTLTAQSYTLQVFVAGSVSCSYGTATVGTPLTFTATAGTTTFTPSGAALWILTATSYPTPYVPPGVTQSASNATTSGGNWFTNPDGSPLWKSLDGEPDGVELIPQPLSFSSWWQVTGSTPTTTGLTITTAGAGGYWKDNFMVPGARYRIIVEGTTTCVSGFALTDAGVSFDYMSVKFGAFAYSATVTVGASADAPYMKNMSAGTTTIARLSIQRIQPQPLTLATRIKMGVGSGDYVNGLAAKLIDAQTSTSIMSLSKGGTGESRIVRSEDDSGLIAYIVNVPWDRNAVIKRFVQVNTTGTQFRVGYMIEGTHTAIQWGSWVNFDGSFNPSTIYRLMYGYNNAYPMWLNKLAVWKRQVPDTELLEVFS